LAGLVKELTMENESIEITMDAETIEILLDDRIATGG